MKYLIDHEKRTIHRTTFANDKCQFHETMAEERELSEDMSYIKKLISEEEYTECAQCHRVSVKPDINTL